MRSLLILLLALTAAIGAAQSRRAITPVEPEPLRPDHIQNNAPDKPLSPRDNPNVIESRDAKGLIVLVDTVTGLEVVDSSAIKVPRMIYPSVYRLSAGVNFWDAAMRLIGQKYGVAGVWAQLNMHNRYFPYLEIGLGTADTRPDGADFTYRSPLAPYFKIGASYNMFYNSNPDYQLHAGVRYGLSSFSFSIDDVTLADSYWGETATFSIPSQHSTAGFIEIGVGVKVKLWKRLSAGWDVFYRSVLHQSRCPAGKPMYIPGYGKIGTSFGASLSLSWTFDLNKPAAPTVDNTEGDTDSSAP